MTPSPYQSAIYAWVESGTGSAVVDAVAGSGKTTTIVEICQRIPHTHSVRLFAFNKPIADVLRARVPRHVEASTYHSSGYRAVLRELPARVETDKTKMRDLIREVLGETDRRAYGDELHRLVSLGKANGIGVLESDLPEAWLNLIEVHDLDFQWLIPPRTTEADYLKVIQAEQARVADLAHELLEASNRAALMQFEWRLDFDDQLYLPILWDLQLPRHDWVLVDEAQDTNAIQRALIRKSLKPGGRLIAVGDPRQAIYAWRGASHDAMTLIQREWDAAEFPLSVCYRCAARIVQKAQTLVPQIEAAPGAPLGIVDEQAPLATPMQLASTDAILCRNNAPLVKQAYALIGQGVPCRILGRDIGEGLVKLIRRMGARDLDTLEVSLREYEKRETQRHRKAGSESKAQAIIDKVTCIRTIHESLREDERSVAGLITAIEGLFGDAKQGLLTLATVHKAKGQEWPTVAIIRSDLMPSFWAQRPEAKQQEANLMYVAWTRARERLLIVDDKPDWLRKKEAKARGEQEEPYSLQGDGVY